MDKLKIRAEYLIIIIILVIKTILHLIADFNSGLDGDEIYHVDTGKHLAWGYMEFPPMIGFLAWLQNFFKSDSIFAHHFFVHIAAGLIIVISGLTVIRIGGNCKAVLLCLICILTASCFGLTQNAFQPVIFDQLFWILSFYLLITYIRTNNNLHLFFFRCVNCCRVLNQI
ncbi:MAG: glycosyltransferase family 39 protein [Bacteroidales bacterium]|nr:glycosyltransferase family 39 protein [Bacteroidales bacterium]